MPGLGATAAARWTSRSTASSSRSTSSSCSAAWAWSGATRAGRSPGSSRRPRRSRSSTRIGWNPGKFGDLHPYAMLEPVHVGGVTIKLATLHNEEDLARKDIREGEEVIVLRAGDVIPQVLSPAPHVAEREDDRRRPATARALPGLRHADGQARGLGLHPLPQPRLRRAPLAAAQALRRRDGHRRAGREAGEPVHGARLGRTRRPTSTGWRPSRSPSRAGFGRSRRRKLVAAIEASKASRSAACCSRSGSRRWGDVTGRNLAQQFRSIDALLAADPEAIEQTPGVGPKMARRIHEQLHDPIMQALIADLREPGPALRGGGPAAGRGPAGGQDARADRHPARADARAGDRADHAPPAAA